MSLPAYSTVLDHVGPWTEEDYRALPEDNRRIELVDGALLVSPQPGPPHQRLSFHLHVALDVNAPDGLEILDAVNVRIGPGRILIPDLVVVTTVGISTTEIDAADVLMAVELTSPSNAGRDRLVKPRAYADAGIPYYLRIDLAQTARRQLMRRPAAAAYRLDAGSYQPMAQAGPGEVLRLTEPFAVTLDMAALASTTRLRR